jgi:hypothetical protein
MDAKPFDSDANESRCLADEQELPRVYLPSPQEIESLKRHIRAENEAREALEDAPPYRQMHRRPRVFRTEYSQGRIRN